MIDYPTKCISGCYGDANTCPMCDGFCGCHEKEVGHCIMIDYEALLKKYMEYIGMMEGTDFLAYRDYDWTDEEWEALQRLRP